MFSIGMLIWLPSPPPDSKWEISAHLNHLDEISEQEHLSSKL